MAGVIADWLAPLGLMIAAVVRNHQEIIGSTNEMMIWSRNRGSRRGALLPDEFLSRGKTFVAA